MPPAPASPRVSILVRTKDRPVLLARALDDMLAQTRSDWEAIIVNDGGDAAEVQAVVAARADPFAERVSVIHHQDSKGMEAAANVALAEAAGEFVVIHDDDDTWSPTFLAETVGHLQAHHDAIAVAVRTEIVDEEIRGSEIVETGRRPFGPPHDVVTLLDLLLINRVVPIGLLVRSEAVRRIGGYDESLPVVGDWEFNLRLARAGRIDFLPATPLAFWHQRAQADGALANSMGGGYGAHARYDRLVRDRQLRTDLEAGGTGHLLYLAMLVDEVVQGAEKRIVEAQLQAMAESEQRIVTELRNAIQLYSPAATARRAVRRILRRS
ncbi:glycosyltransferase family A protein [Microbacterium sp. ABRD28]|uniref:glycosyltransferase family 2 protein n=1 Tax=Microbacterium sp. ABRD28 TaxID=2268461 RepID=UPI0013DDC067|nr:glycosyltransferase family A protein [Microbacterium sp. ABRD28]